ncbi:MAG: glycosyltransferase family 4 protein [Tenericutes bacterium]|nr:glycosyltransferase family 4 protein [Mycoplasmatota bacterium]
MEKRTIWLISKYASPPSYGVGSRLYYIAKEFSKSDNNVLLISSDSNHLATYPVTDSTYNIEHLGQLKHLWIKTYKYKRSSSFKRFLSWIDFDIKLFKSKKFLNEIPDIVVVSSLSLTSIIFGLHLKKKYNCKLVFEIRDIYPLTLTEELGFSKKHLIVRLLGRIEREGYRKADLIVGTMPNLTEHVKQITKENKKVFYSPLGIPKIWENELVYNHSVDLLFPKRKFVVGYAGSMGKSNSLDSYIIAIKKCSVYHKNIHFVLVGSGELRESYIEQLSGCKNVTFGPRIKQEEIPFFLSKCDLLYLSTHKSMVWKYGQSMNKMIDYMMSGKPIIASYDGYQSMINEANSGVYIPANDSESIIKTIVYFFKLPLKKKLEYGENGKKWVLLNHNYQSIAQNYLSKIKSI